ncbi:MAG: dATP pyrophosphohydrolase [Pseudomonadota bacterium]
MLVVIYSADGHFLLIERAANPGYWQSVTGSQESGESFEQTAARELLEETGLVAEKALLASELGRRAFPVNILINHQFSTQYEILPVWRHRYAPGITSNTEHWFSLKLPSPRNVRLDPAEHLAQGWFLAPEATQKCFSPSNQALINQLGSREFVTKLA